MNYSSVKQLQSTIIGQHDLHISSMLLWYKLWSLLKKSCLVVENVLQMVNIDSFFVNFHSEELVIVMNETETNYMFCFLE